MSEEVEPLDVYEEIDKIFAPSEDEAWNGKPDIHVGPIEGGFQIEVRSMYEPIKLGLDRLKKLSELFGTDKIDVDNYSQRGCETCDYGSSYGHDVQVLGATKNSPL